VAAVRALPSVQRRDGVRQPSPGFQRHRRRCGLRSPPGRWLRSADRLSQGVGDREPWPNSAKPHWVGARRASRRDRGKADLGVCKVRASVRTRAVLQPAEASDGGFLLRVPCEPPAFAPDEQAAANAGSTQSTFAPRNELLAFAAEALVEMVMHRPGRGKAAEAYICCADDSELDQLRIIEVLT
jgi:hypothetical protein